MKRKLLFVLLLPFAIVACGPSRVVNILVTRPAAISFPPEVKSLAIVDRTRPESRALNILEGIFSGEMPEEDRIAAQEAVNSLRNELGNSPRYSVRLCPERLNGNSLTAAFPEPLSWQKVGEICERENSEVLLSLEIMDSDFIVTNGSRIRNRREGAREVAFTEFYAQGLGNIKMGIRAYYPKTNAILDQQIVNTSRSWEGVGNSAAAAAALLINKAEANRQLARMIAADYAYKISPMPVWVNRSMYGKSRHCPEIESGRRFADVGKWKEAGEIWKNAVPAAPDPKTAGMLAYNTAVAFEVLGDLNLALQWAQDSYTRYGNPQGRNYAQVIQQRMREEEILKQQMNR